MFERYSEHAQSVMDRARQEAQNLRHDHLGTEHILLGLLEVKDGCAATVLRHRKLDVPHAKEQIEKLVTHGSGPESGDYGTLPPTRHAQSVIDDAVKEARELKHPKIGTEHLLLGLLHENQGVGAKVLRNLGFKLSEIRKDVLYFLKHQ